MAKAATANALNNTTDPITITLGSFYDCAATDAPTPPFAVTIWPDAFSNPQDVPATDREIAYATAYNPGTASITLSRPDAKVHAGTPWVGVLVIAAHINDLTKAALAELVGALRAFR